MKKILKKRFGMSVVAPNVSATKNGRTMEVDVLAFSNADVNEVAQVLGIKPSAAVNRYVRALKRLKDVFEEMPGGIEGIWG